MTGAAEDLEHPEADCLVDAEGGVHFTVRAAGPQGGEPAAGDLLLRRRREHGEEVRLALRDGHALLPVSRPLPEGRWNVYLDHPDADGPVRLVPGLNDLRALVDLHQTVPPATSPLRIRIPYATVESNLALVCFERARHAEAGDLRADEGTLTVHGRLYGAELSPAATLEARIRDTDVWHRLAQATGAGPDFAATVPYDVPAAHGSGGGKQLWDLALRPGPEAEPVRIGRILDDIALKKDIFIYPATVVSASRGSVRVKPYYTVDNGLSLAVTPADEGA